MNWLREIARRLWALVHRNQFDSDLQEEVRLHLELREQEEIERGLSPKEAHYAVQSRFGNELLLREKSRDMWRWIWLEDFIQDVRYGLRVLVKNPGFAVVAVLTLALGVGINAAMFSVINTALLTPLPYKNPDRLVWLGTRFPGFNHPIPVSGPDFLDWRSQNHVFESMAAMDETGGFTLTGKGEPEMLPGGLVSANFFKVFDQTPELGRGFLEGEDQPGRNHVAVLSYNLWKNRFGSNPNAIGNDLTLDGESYTIVGVAPPLTYPSWVQFWSPIVINAQQHPRGNHYLRAIGRLKPGVTLPQAQAEMSTIASRIAGAYPENKGVGVQLTLLKEQFVQYIRPALLVLFGAVGFVLLIACANVANLLLAKATKRQREITLRAALGAGRSRLIRQFLTESVLLSLFAGGLGILVATWSLDVLRTLKPANIPDVNSIHLDLHVLGFLLAITFSVGIALGLAPAWHASKLRLNESLKESGGAGLGGATGGNLRNVLVVAEIALSLVLLVGAGLMIRSFAQLLSIDPGYDPKNLLTFQISLPNRRYPNSSQVTAFCREALERISACPGVRSVAMSYSLPPFGFEIDGGFYVEGHEPSNHNEAPDTILGLISPGYFQTLKTPLIEGRDFTEQDNNERSRVVIINETMARGFFGGRGVVGKRMKTAIDGMKDWYEVIGVVADERFFGWDSDLSPWTYFPYIAYPIRDMTFAVRTRIDPMHVSSSVRRAIWSIDKDLPFTEVSTMEQRLSQSFAGRRFHMILLGVFAALALVLSLVGIYGVMSYSVAQRTHEIGIRIALGAERHQVLRLVLKQGLVVTAIGLGIGLAGAFALTRFLASMLYGVHPTDTVTFVLVSLLLVASGLLACYVPGRRATKVDPMIALRYE
jgi:putative ABC transport system permease protein